MSRKQQNVGGSVSPQRSAKSRSREASRKETSLGRLNLMPNLSQDENNLHSRAFSKTFTSHLLSSNNTLNLSEVEAISDSDEKRENREKSAKYA